ncbi:hypothetical protein Dimus_039424 [Dionaea muscipula]
MCSMFLLLSTICYLVTAYTLGTSITFSFTHDACTIQDTTQVMLIGMGRPVGSLYYLLLLESSPGSSVNSFASSGYNSIKTDAMTSWYYRLGHPSNMVLPLLTKVLHLDCKGAFP